MTKRVLVITSCTGEKKHKPRNQLLLEDFKDKDKLIIREEELSNYKIEAGHLYTGSQHKALMDGVRSFRENGGNIEVDIISAGYGLINEYDVIVPYEVTFNSMTPHDIYRWSSTQEITVNLQKRIADFDIIFFLLGDRYLQSVNWPLKISDNQKLFFFIGNSSRSRVLKQEGDYALTIGAKEAKRFKFGLIGIKGFLFSKLLQSVSKNPQSGWGNIYNNPETIRKSILDSFIDGTEQLELFEEKNELDSILSFHKELFPVPDDLLAINYKSSELMFYMPENDDRVDPHFNFQTDLSKKNRNPLINDLYAHEIYDGNPQYDGILVSKTNIDSGTQMKKRLVYEQGIHEFLRLPDDYPIMGDCGAFSYISDEEPPYTTQEIINYYQDLGFNFGVSIDHLIVGDMRKDKVLRKKRYDLTIDMAEQFIKLHKEEEYTFQPIGIIQGWNPSTYSKAARHLISIGYDRIAIGSVAREQSENIYAILKEISPYIPNEDFKIHLFGVARDMNVMKIFHKLGATSFDSASPLRRAWLGSGHNYHAMDGKHYTAIRIPVASETSGRIKKMLQEGRGEFQQYKALELEALNALRKFSIHELDIDSALTAILRYDELLGGDRKTHEDLYFELLSERPWEKCGCVICSTIGIDVVVFRGNNRNRRRGFHNTHAYYSQVKKYRENMFT